MQLKMNKINEIINISDNENIIEYYKLSETIDFNKLISYLLTKELKEKINLIVGDFQKNEQENVLIGLINDIVNDYNNKVDDFDNFVKDISNNY